ncbi:MAG: diguanylate cyclase [Arcobacteraceae bacterium]|jgi:diguanylate cyclase (GGDEF)-like protein|nr:diguanylate cyclase [Arcobacteraceae bacterium]
MTALEDLMYKEHISIEKSGTIEDAIRLMDKNHQGVVVIIKENIPIGVLTERNILEVIQQNIDQTKLIVDVFTFQTPVTINRKRSVDYALHILIDNTIRRLVVVNGDGSFKGVVTQEVLVKNLERNSFKTDILISQLMDTTRNLVSLSENDTIFNAFDTMTKQRVGSVIATNEKGEATGILTEKDAIIIANKKIATTLPISSVMSSPIICAKQTTPLKDLIDIMSKNKINRIVITDADTNKPINIISMRDITHNLKGNYGQLLEYKLKNIKNTLNYIGEYIIEIYEDNDEQIIQWMNTKAIEKFGNYLDKNVEALIEEERWRNIFNLINQNGKCNKYKIQIKDMHFTINCSYHFSNKKETLLLVLQDITELTNVISDEKSKNETLSTELKIVKSVIDQQNNIIFVTNGKDISLTNKAFLDLFDMETLEDFCSKFTSIESTFIMHQNFFTMSPSSTNWLEEIDTLYEKNRVVSIIDYKSFEPKVFSVQLNKITSDSKNYIVTFTDITEEKLESHKYYFNATHDGLTKIYNKSFFLDSLNISLNKTKRYHLKFSLVFFNIDNLKLVNAHYGFLHGDIVVNEIAKVVNQNIRTCDVFARYSGDDFAIILPETNISKGELLAENVRKIIENITFKDINSQTASFGVTQFLEIDNENTLIQRAQKALAIAKENGKNKIVIL